MAETGTRHGRDGIERQVERHAHVTAILFDAKLRRSTARIISQLATHFPIANYNANLLFNHTTRTANPTTIPPQENQLQPVHYRPNAYTITQQQQQQQQPNEQDDTYRTLNLRRVNVLSVARFFALTSTIISLLRLTYIITLALFNTISKTLPPTTAIDINITNLINQIAEHTLTTRVRDEHLYNFLVDLLSSQDPTLFLNQSVNFANYHLSSTLYLAFVFCTPMVEGLLFYLLGILLSTCLNISLILCQGINIQFV